MKIGILQTGHAPEELRAKHGDYDAMFRSLLDRRGFDFETYAVLDNLFPDTIEAADGWLITGSRHGVYEDHDWIEPLKAFLRQAFTSGRPIVGVCFGHQILAQALGGHVEKFQGGWSIGNVEYNGKCGPQNIMAWHQDQVVKLPKHARVIGSSDFCANAMLAYDDIALTVQPHPEFSEDFMADLLDLRGHILSKDILEKAKSTLRSTLTSSTIADLFTEFFKRPRNHKIAVNK